MSSQVDTSDEAVEALARFIEHDNSNMVREAAAMLRALAAERDALRAALEIIAGERQCIDNLMSNVDVARAALKGNTP